MEDSLPSIRMTMSWMPLRSARSGDLGQPASETWGPCQVGAPRPPGRASRTSTRLASALIPFASTGPRPRFNGKPKGLPPDGSVLLQVHTRASRFHEWPIQVDTEGILHQVGPTLREFS